MLKIYGAASGFVLKNLEDTGKNKSIETIIRNTICVTICDVELYAPITT